jgi:hypothetical protein
MIGREFEERAVALIGLDHQEIAAPHAGVRSAHGADASAHHNGGIEAGEIEDGGGERGGRSSCRGCPATAMPYFRAHQFGEKFAARDDGDLQAACLLHFRILFVHGGTHDESACAGDVGRRMAFEDTRTHDGQALGDRRQFHVASRDLVAQI